MSWMFLLQSLLLPLPITDPLLLTLDFRSSDVCFMPTSSWSACACPSSGPRQTSPSLNGQWFWPCLIQYYQVFPVFCTPCMGFYEAASSAVWVKRKQVSVFSSVWSSHCSPLLTRVLQESCSCCCVSLPSCIAGSTSLPSCCNSPTGCFIRCVVWPSTHCHSSLVATYWSPLMDICYYQIQLLQSLLTWCLFSGTSDKLFCLHAYS